MSVKTVSRLKTERDEARQIVQDIYWMARRYADGRLSYAPGMYNDAIRKAVEAGWLRLPQNDEGVFAAEGKWPEADPSKAKQAEAAEL